MGPEYSLASAKTKMVRKMDGSKSRNHWKMENLISLIKRRRESKGMYWIVIFKDNFCLKKSQRFCRILMTFMILKDYQDFQFGFQWIYIIRF